MKKTKSWNIEIDGCFAWLIVATFCVTVIIIVAIVCGYSIEWG